MHLEKTVKRPLLTAMLALPFIMIGCGGGGLETSEVNANEAATALKHVGSAIDGIMDEDSAKAALPRIQESIAQYMDFKSKLDAMKDLPPADKTRAYASMASAVAELTAKTDDFKQKNPKAFKIIEPEIAKIK